MTDARFADLPFTRHRQEVLYCRRLRYDINANMEVKDGDPQLQYWDFHKPYTSPYQMRGSHRTCTLECETSQRAVVRNSVLGGWHHLKLFAVPSRRESVIVTMFRFLCLYKLRKLITCFVFQLRQCLHFFWGASKKTTVVQSGSLHNCDE